MTPTCGIKAAIIQISRALGMSMAGYGTFHHSKLFRGNFGLGEMALCRANGPKDFTSTGRQASTPTDRKTLHPAGLR